MNIIDMEYLNEYNPVECFCKQTYGDGGVRTYIEEMESASNKGKMFVRNWDEEIKTLKHLKELRNKIAHNDGPYEVTEKDFADIRLFYNKLLTQQDPLTLLRKGAEEYENKKYQQKYKLREKEIQSTKQPTENNAFDNQNPKIDSDIIIGAIGVAATVIAIIAIIFFFFH